MKAATKTQILLRTPFHANHTLHIYIIRSRYIQKHNPEVYTTIRVITMPQHVSALIASCHTQCLSRQPTFAQFFAAMAAAPSRCRLAGASSRAPSPPPRRLWRHSAHRPDPGQPQQELYCCVNGFLPRWQWRRWPRFEADRPAAPARASRAHFWFMCIVCCLSAVPIILS